ncbi:MAG: efflux RND transporter periplasmic adaptor subunit [Cyclobacteriaceae bacterium]|nr:efflux RND transporter periplasmic adaptor subunit [Cyclobacteriaceae bacterium]MDH4297093.1 efflux RND transporter periplasmic adaptor subunit [Cyclobacteriaceae bacterium]MDH5249166.1 efflux RND transporter periplasmic adaptor subunit [Cyclobacteriaceae bacterium]
MKRFLTLIIATILISVLASCNRNEVDFDASGSFEAEETIISAETSGTIREFDVEEGQVLAAGKRIGYIDSTQLYLKKKQLEAQINAMLSKRPNMAAQSAALKEQLSTAETEQKRIANLVKSDAATTKQLDDINATIEVIKKQIEAQRSSLSITTEGINKDASVLRVQIAQLNDDLRKCKLVNPVNGTVLTKYAESYEVTSPGKPLYKIADLSTILMRAYVTGNQLPLIKLNQKVNVLTDDGSGGYKQTAGLITWINDKAEFTPKTIQTKDERANMVYAIKIKVTNDGSYKIGMYGEVKF